MTGGRRSEVRGQLIRNFAIRNFFCPLRAPSSLLRASALCPSALCPLPFALCPLPRRADTAVCPYRSLLRIRAPSSVLPALILRHLHREFLSQRLETLHPGLGCPLAALFQSAHIGIDIFPQTVVNIL